MLDGIYQGANQFHSHNNIKLENRLICKLYLNVLMFSWKLRRFLPLLFQNEENKIIYISIVGRTRQRQIQHCLFRYQRIKANSSRHQSHPSWRHLYCRVKVVLWAIIQNTVPAEMPQHHKSPWIHCEQSLLLHYFIALLNESFGLPKEMQAKPWGRWTLL